MLAASQLFHAFNVRSYQSLFKAGFFTNKYMNGAFVVSFLLVALIAFVPPIAGVFGLIMLPASYYLLALGLAFLPVICVEIAKIFIRIYQKNHND